MKRMIAAALIPALAFTLMLSACAGNEGDASSYERQTVSSKLEKPSAQTLKEGIVGYWGRLGEVMHEFHVDGSGIVGGMRCTYEVDDDCTLVITSQGGTTVSYVWDDMTQQNYWSLDGDRLVVNGNEFARITDTPDET